MTIFGDDEILATSMRNTCWAFAITTARGKTKSLLIAQRWFAKADANHHPTASLHLD